MAHITFIKPPRIRRDINGYPVSARLLAVDGTTQLVDTAMCRIQITRVYIHPRDYGPAGYEGTESVAGVVVPAFNLDIFQEEILSVSYD